jgi:hypothetical protein
VLGLRYFSARIGSDLGRYRGDSRWARHARKADGGVDGHFAWMLVWQIQDTTRWHRAPAPARHQLRAGSVSVAFDDRMTPSLVEAAGTYYLPAAVNRQHGFGPATDGFLLSRPMGEVRVRDVAAGGLTAKLVTKPVVGRDHVLRHVRSLYVTDGTSLWTTVAVERLPGTPYLLAGLPYAADDGDRVLRTSEPRVTSAGALRLTHPSPDDPRTTSTLARTPPRNRPPSPWPPTRAATATPTRAGATWSPRPPWRPVRPPAHPRTCTSSPCATAGTTARSRPRSSATERAWPSAPRRSRP